MKQPCGHSISSIVSSRGGTNHCGECEAAAKELEQNMKNLTSDQRSNIRSVLLDTGFTRASFTESRADGSYEEIWTHPDGSKVELRWNK